MLRLLKEVYGVTFKIKISVDDDIVPDDTDTIRANDAVNGAGRTTVLLSCYGIGYSNVNRRVT